MTELTENPGYFSPETTEEALRNANPLNDALFKFLFANERNRENMLRLLNDIMPERRVLDFEYKDREHDANREGGHRSYFDVRLKADDGRICHVEVQLWHEAAMFERVVYYAAHSFTDQLLEGEGYGTLNPVVFIVILKNTLFRDSPEHWRTTFQLTARETGETRDCLEFHFFELDKLERLFAEGKVEDDSLTRLLRYLGRMGGENEMEQLALSDTGLAKIRRNEREFFREPGNLATYIMRQREEIDYQNMLKDRLNQGIAEGHAEGIAEGIALGEARGIALGEKRGIALGEERGRAEALLDTARNMLTRGFSIEDTAEITGLSLDEVRALRRN